jgi:hypothetical protein
MSFPRGLLSASEQAAERYKVRCQAPVNCKNWMISNTATIHVRRGLELQLGVIKKEGIEHPQSMLDVGLFRGEIGSSISDPVSPLLRYY